jgi:hypothetical protein
MLNAKDDELDLPPLTEADYAALRELPHPTPEDWHWRFNFLAKIRLQILESEKLTIDELIEQSEHQLAELMVGFLEMEPDEQTRHAVKLKATLTEVMKLKEINRQKALALIKRDYGAEGVEFAEFVRAGR